MNTKSLTATIAAGLVTLAACGDGDDPLTEAEFIAAADSICEDANREAAPFFEQIWSGLDDLEPDDSENETSIFQRWVDALDDIEPIAREQLDRLRALDPPEADQELITDLLEDHDVALDDFITLMEAAASGDQGAMATLESNDPVSAVEARLRDYGFEVCGSDGS